MSTDQRIFDGAEYPVPTAEIVHDTLLAGGVVCHELFTYGAGHVITGAVGVFAAIRSSVDCVAPT